MHEKEKMQELTSSLESLARNMRASESALLFLPEIDELERITASLRADILDGYFYKLGTAKNETRAAASRENGKKGGRPPKRIAELRKQKAELQAEIDLYAQQPMDTDREKEQEKRLALIAVSTELEQAEKEYAGKRNNA